MDNIARNWDVAKLLKQHCSSHQYYSRQYFPLQNKDALGIFSAQEHQFSLAMQDVTITTTTEKITGIFRI